MTTNSDRLNAAIFSTSLGWMVILGRDDVLSRLRFGAVTKGEAQRQTREEFGEDVAFVDWNPELRARLQDYATGGRDDFLDVKIDATGLTDFTQQVLAQCRQISPGETTTYGELATSVGSPGAARAVGAAMARNRVPIVIPCHRVVGRDGRLTGFSAPGGCDMKRRMLDLEAENTVLT